MAGTTDFVPFAAATGANVVSQASYIAEASTTAGYSSGEASSANCNKTWRQGTFIAAGIATFTANALNINVADDGNLTNFVNNFASALNATITTALTGYATQAWVNSQGFATTTFASNASNLSVGTLNQARLPSSFTVGGTITASTLTGGTVTSGGSISAAGGISAGGTVSGAALSASGAVSGATVSATGTVSGATVNSSGGMTAAGTITGGAFNVSSDERLKKNFRLIEDALDRVDLLHGWLFQWKEGGGEDCAGLRAQALQAVLPQGVREVKGRLVIDPMAAIALLTEWLHRERRERRALEARLAVLEAR